MTKGKSAFKRNYATGIVTMPNGVEVDVMTLPEVSLKKVAVYGFIRSCQDPMAAEKDQAVRLNGMLAIAQDFISGVVKEKVKVERGASVPLVSMIRLLQKAGMEDEEIEKELKSLGKKQEDIDKAFGIIDEDDEE